MEETSQASQNDNRDDSETSSVWIVIPAYNEETAIASVIADIRTAGYENILVVDDGSRDHTATIAEQAGAEVLKHILNRGQGAALKTGIQYLRETYDPDVIVTFDADGQHDARDLASIIRPVLNQEVDIVLGSRFLERHHSIPFFRKMTLRLGIIFTNVVSRIHLTDTHNGFRALGRKAYQTIEITHRGMEHASDIIDEISRHHLRYCEVPVKITYSEYSLQKGQKSSNFLKIGIKILLKKLL
jgi:glycosyltransferase involved in cell wall biosynthesis